MSLSTFWCRPRSGRRPMTSARSSTNWLMGQSQTFPHTKYTCPHLTHSLHFLLPLPSYGFQADSVSRPTSRPNTQPAPPHHPQTNTLSPTPNTPTPQHHPPPPTQPPNQTQPTPHPPPPPHFPHHPPTHNPAPHPPTHNQPPHATQQTRAQLHPDPPTNTATHTQGGRLASGRGAARRRPAPPEPVRRRRRRRSPVLLPRPSAGLPGRDRLASLARSVRHSQRRSSEHILGVRLKHERIAATGAVLDLGWNLEGQQQLAQAADVIADLFRE